MELGKTSHSVYKIRYHMVTAVKYRKDLLNSEVENCITETLEGISERYEIVIDEVGFDHNHIHIFCGAPPKIAPLRVISIIKSITARKIFEKFPNFKKQELGEANFGATAYIGTVGEATSETTVKKYIRNHSVDKKESETRIKQLKLFDI